MKIPLILSVLTGSLLFSGCSAGRSLILKSAQPFFDDTMTSLLRESDPEIARAAMASDLKLVEGILVSSPDNRGLLTTAAQGFAGYSMLYYDPQEPEKARNLYRRSIEYGLKALGEGENLFALHNNRYEDFEKWTASLDEDDTDAVYWTAVAWGGLINLSKTDPNAIAEFPRVVLLMEWIHRSNPDYFFGGPLWFFGVYYATLPPILGGDPEMSRQYFERALELTEGKFLWGKLLYAQTYAVQTLNRNLFLKLIDEILESDIDDLPDARLLNQVAKGRAAELQTKVDELF